MDNFTNETTASVLEKTNVQEQGIILVLAPAGTTDCLQSLDASTNKAEEDFLRNIQQWYTEQVQKQFEAGMEEATV